MKCAKTSLPLVCLSSKVIASSVGAPETSVTAKSHPKNTWRTFTVPSIFISIIRLVGNM